MEREKVRRESWRPSKQVELMMKRIETSKRLVAALIGALSIGAAGAALAQQRFVSPALVPAPRFTAAAAPPGMAMPFNPGAIPNPAVTINRLNQLSAAADAAAASGTLPFNPGAVVNPAATVNPSNPLNLPTNPGAIVAAPGTADGGMAGQAVTDSAPQLGANGDYVAPATVTANGQTSIIGAFRWSSNHILDYTAGTIDNGTFTVTDSRGDQLFGTYTGSFDGLGGFQLNYVMTGGTGAFARATGSGVITGAASGNAFQASIV